MKTLSVVGRLGSDVEVKYGPTGTAILQASVACDYQKKGQNGGYERATQWVRVIVFGKRAESLAKVLQKGMRVAASGDFQLNEWTDKNGGGNRVSVEMIASDIEPLFDKKQDGEARPRNQQTSQADAQAGYADDSEIPF